MTSRPAELLISLVRDGPRTLGGQIEDQIRAAVRAGTLRPGAAIPSTRDLAEQLGISRPLVVEAYAQLSAEGFLTLRQGARPQVSASTLSAPPTPAASTPLTPLPRFDLRPAAPDLNSFPSARWVKATREALAKMAGRDFDYEGQHGRQVLRDVLAEYLGRVRGVVADPAHVVVTSGFAQGRSLACRALSALGAKRIAVEDPSYVLWEPIRRTGLEIVPILVDDDGIRVDLLEDADADAVMLTPAHQFPTGVVMSGERRMQLQNWLRRTNAFAIEDDYDSEFRYDRAPIRALQGLDPDHVIYAGTASKTLAPALRMGWLVVPPRLLATVHKEQTLIDMGCSRIEQHILAEFIASGDFDRHLRRMRIRYRARRDALLAALAIHIPEARVQGISAGLHATVRLPEDYDEHAIQQCAQRRGVDFWLLSEQHVPPRRGIPTLLLGYARCSEATLHDGVQALAAAIREIRHQARN